MRIIKTVRKNEVESMVATPSVSSYSESLTFLTMLHQVSSGVLTFSECLDFSLEFLQICVCPSKVIPLAVSEVRPLR